MDTYLAVIATVIAISAFFRFAIRKPAKWKLHLYFSVFAIAYLVIAAFVLNYAENQVRTRHKEKLLSYAPSYAFTLGQLGHEKISQATSEKDSTYLSMIELERGWLKANTFVTDIYTMKKQKDGHNQLIVDSETDYDRSGSIDQDREQRTAIGEVYDKDIPELEAAFQGKASFTDTPYSDKWGNWVSAFVPIYDSSGQIDGVLGIDFDSKIFMDEIRSEKDMTSLSILLLYALIFVIFLFSEVMLDKHQALQSALQTAKTAVETKSQFLANMSHEIRTPMNGVLGMTQLLFDTPINKEQREFLNTIRDCGESLLAIINDILDFSKIEANKIEIDNHPINLHKTIESVLKMLELKAHDKNIALKFSSTEISKWDIVTDSTRLKQILVNLINNAIKFTDEGQVELTLRSQALSPNRFEFHFSVKDTGIGIPQERINRLFQSFSQVDGSTARKYGGTGLGLVISKKFVEAMGGQMSVTSEYGKGSTFSFWIVADLCNADQIKTIQKDQNAEGEVVSKGSLKILVADDNQVNLNLMLKYLEKCNFKADVAENGRQAFEMAQRNNYDLILTDSHMPYMTGEEVAVAVRNSEEIQDQPMIVAVTASAFKEDEERCLSVGMDDFLRKPLRLNDLVRVLNLALARKGDGMSPDQIISRALGGDEGLMFEIYELILKELPQNLRDLTKAVQKNHPQDIHNTAHKLKGTVAHFEGSKILVLALELEQIGKSQNLAMAEEKLRQISHEAENFLQFIAEKLASKNRAA